MLRIPYLTDLSDAEWNCIAPLLPVPCYMGVHGFILLLKSSMPSSTSSEVDALGACFPTICLAFQTVCHYFHLRRRNGLWEQVHAVLRERVRLKMGREGQSSAGIIDSQSVKTSGLRGPRGYNADKNIKGRKHHLLVDTTSVSSSKRKFIPPTSWTAMG